MRGNNVALGWERAVLGTALAEPSTMDEAEDLLPTDFTGCHQTLWNEMLALHRRNALDLRALVEQLRSAELLAELVSFDAESITGEAYLADLMGYRGSAMHEYADRVMDASLKRQLRQVAALIRADAEDERVSAREASDEAERRLLQLRRARGAEMGASLADLLAVFNTRIDGFRAGTLEPAWVPYTTAIRSVVKYFVIE
jgi:replicative DNA helicase